MTLPHSVLSLIKNGPIVDVTIRRRPLGGRASLTASAAALAHLGLDPPSSIEARMLVDTGSQFTVVDAQRIETLGIPPSDFLPKMQLVGTAIRDVPIYRVELELHLNGGAVTLSTAVLGLAGHLDEVRIHGLLGRETLQKAVFHYDGPQGAFEMRKGLG